MIVVEWPNEIDVFVNKKFFLLRQVGAQVADYYKQAFRKIESSNSKADSLTAEETIAEVVGMKLSKAWTRYLLMNISHLGYFCY